MSGFLRVIIIILVYNLLPQINSVLLLHTGIILEQMHTLTTLCNKYRHLSRESFRQLYSRTCGSQSSIFIRDVCMWKWHNIGMISAGVRGSVIIDDQRAYIKIQALHGKTPDQDPWCTDGSVWRCDCWLKHKFALGSTFSWRNDFQWG